MHASSRFLQVLSLVALVLPVLPVRAATNTPGDLALSNYFRAETKRLSENCLAEIQTLADWERLRPRYREELFEMLGLSPLPARSDLQPVVTGRVEEESFVVENLHFQSRPGLYVTANLYLPKNLSKPAPTILYLSGHGPVISNGVSYGNKVSYQHHGAWFARNGYVCLVLDSLQLGEILGLHHGTYRENLWWWNARGYSPAGVEAWNCIRALDYLATRREVDTNRYGATGRSGGGAYSWWIAALDDRIKAAAPVAGITDLHNHVVDGTVEGHCDCMFTVNTYRWDYPQVAALVAPRPLLIVNTDADSIFPLDGVQRTHAAVRRIYGLHKAQDKLGLVIGPGPHKDTQDLQVPVFRWFNKYLKGEDPVIEMAATKFFTPQQLKVFATLPVDAINTNIHETFVLAAKTPAIPRNSREWERQRNEWMAALREKVFRGWPAEGTPLQIETKVSVPREGRRLEILEFDSQPDVRLRLYCVSNEGQPRSGTTTLEVLDERSWPAWLSVLRTRFADELGEELDGRGLPATVPNQTALKEVAVAEEEMRQRNTTLVLFAPRGIGMSAWTADARKQTHIQRRFMLEGQTLDAMRVWDIRRACQALRQTPRTQSGTLSLRAEGTMAVNTVYVALFEPDIRSLLLASPSPSHHDGPDYLNVLRFLDVPQAVAMASERCEVLVNSNERGAWEFPAAVADALGWKDRFRVEPVPR